jgi:hypothetical protein
MFEKSRIISIAVAAGLFAAQSVTTAMAGPTIVVKIGEGISIGTGQDEFTPDDEPGAEDPGFDGPGDESLADEDFTPEDEGETVAEPATPTVPELIIRVLSCGQSKMLLKNAGYSKLRLLQCGRTQHVYRAKKDGEVLHVAVNPATQAISVM